MNIQEYINFKDNYIIFTTPASQDFVAYLLKAFIPAQEGSGLERLLDVRSVGVVGSPLTLDLLKGAFHTVPRIRDSNAIIFNNILSNYFFLNLIKIRLCLSLGKKILIIQDDSEESSVWSQVSLLKYKMANEKNLISKLKKMTSIYCHYYFFFCKKRILCRLFPSSISVEKIAYGMKKGCLYNGKFNPAAEGLAFFFKTHNGEAVFEKFDKNDISAFKK